MFNKTPAELLFIDDEYTAFCLNQACAYIRAKIEQDEEMPTFKVSYSSFTALYESIEER
jgi:hypothetical protein|nr:MAG TPA: hypothetical protein [Caudoviricetes sp.]